MSIYTDEEGILRAVKSGVLRVDRDGTVWRCKRRQVGNGWSRWDDITPTRAEHDSGHVLSVRVTAGGGIRMRASVPRLVWRLYKGPIPSDTDVVHRDNDYRHNAIENLELGAHGNAPQRRRRRPLPSARGSAKGKALPRARHSGCGTGVPP